MTRRPVSESSPARSRIAMMTRARVVAVVAAAGVALAVTGCTPQNAASTPSPSATSSAGGEAVPAAPEAMLIPNGTAQQNLPFFDKVNKATLAANPDAKGRDLIDGLVAAGFAKADMQVTADMTTIGLKANSLQFSVRMGESCLIGQRGVDWDGYTSMVTPVLATGTCLIGQTRTIDW